MPHRRRATAFCRQGSTCEPSHLRTLPHLVNLGAAHPFAPVSWSIVRHTASVSDLLQTITTNICTDKPTCILIYEGDTDRVQARSERVHVSGRNARSGDAYGFLTRRGARVRRRAASTLRNARRLGPARPRSLNPCD